MNELQESQSQKIKNQSPKRIVKHKQDIFYCFHNELKIWKEINQRNVEYEWRKKSGKTIKFPNETPKKSIFFMETKKQQ